jgi:lipoprotein-releasing system permease protein
LNLPIYIAKRYFFSKKSHHIINIISWISVAGIGIGTMSLIIVLSVFNGFQHLVTTLFSEFNPDIQITASIGKTFHNYEIPADKIKKIPGLANYIEIVEDNALLKYGDKQYIATIKGVGRNYDKLNRLDTTIVKGKYMPEQDDRNFAVMGYGVAYNLGINLNDFTKPVSVYIPKRGRTSMTDPTQAFNNELIYPSGFFSIQQEIDSKYIIVPITFVRKMLDYKDEVTSVEIGLTPHASVENVKEEIQNLTGSRFIVKNRFEQEATLFKIMKSEKWAVFLILSFILLIAAFNVIGSVTMLILDKKKDITVLASMGLDKHQVRNVFLIEGLMINLVGVLSGIITGLVVCLLQLKYGFVQLQSSGTFIIKAYPVQLQLMDFVFVFLIVIVIGFFAAYYPARIISKRYIYTKL